MLSGRPLKRGFLIATAMSLLFLMATAYTSAATLLSRVQATEVMRAASQGVWSGRIGAQMAYFGVAQVLLHVSFGALAWLLAWASAVLWPSVRVKFGRIVVGWFSLLAGATLAYNAVWYPRTLIGAHYHDAAASVVGPFQAGQWIYFGVFGFACAVLAAAAALVLKRVAIRHQKRLLMGTASLGVLAALVAVLGQVGWADAPVRTVGRPHVIVLGIDSLRLDQLKRFGGQEGNTPNLDRFLEDADVFVNTTTPAARTFSSWTAILTGRSPTATGARFNLAPRDTVAANPTIADVLRGTGYRTVYSTDEVRFANIDESFGFDQVITPPIGASDFLIGTYNELPLASVVINTRLGQLLFPFSYGNRGVATMFQPQTYLGRLERELRFDEPTFFIAHLTASHWPYYTSETPFGVSAQEHSEDRPMYRIGLNTADRMFGKLVTMLERKGALENALVVVLSDHGEALGLANDTFIEAGAIIEGLGAPLRMMDAGHGQSVLSPSQYRVLLGFRTFGQDPSFVTTGTDISSLATVEDIAPTVLNLLGIDDDPLNTSGFSFAELLRSAAAPVAAGADPQRIRFTETDLAVLPSPNGGVDEVSTARANSKFFTIDPQAARLHLRHDFTPLALAYKERAAFTSRDLLAALPAGPYLHQYVYFDMESGTGRLLLGRPGPELRDGQRLWDELHVHFDGELRPPTRVTLEDWPVFDEQWKNFLADQKSRSAALTVGGTSEPAGDRVEVGVAQ